MLSIIDEAQGELRDTARSYEDEREGLGQEFLETVEKAFEKIEANPFLFPKLETLRTRREIRRVVLKRFPYIVVYEAVTDDQIKVLAVSHDRRRPNYWKKRLLDD